MKNEIGNLLQGLMTRSTVAALEHELGKLPQLKPEMRHYWAPGVYAREIFLPAGVCVTGKIHLHAHMSVVLGDITVGTAFGQERITGFDIRLAPAGVKRAVLTHADTWWVAIHANPTNERDLAKLEAMFIAKDYDELDERLGVVS